MGRFAERMKTCILLMKGSAVQIGVKRLSAALLTLLLLTSCSSGHKDTLKLSDMGSTQSFCYQTDIPLGTEYQTIYDRYYDEKIDPESDQFEERRNTVLQQNGYRSVVPVKTEKLYGVDWETNFNFDENGLLYTGIYNTSMDWESFEKWIPEVVADCYTSFGESNLSQDELLSLLLDPENDQVSNYWLAEDETFFQLIRLSTRKGAAFSLCIGRSDMVALWFGAKDLPAIFDTSPANP